MAQNATTHGALQAPTLLLESLSPDERVEAHTLLERLRAEHQPETLLDEYEIQSILIALVRLRRVQEREAGLRREQCEFLEQKIAEE